MILMTPSPDKFGRRYLNFKQVNYENLHIDIIGCLVGQ